MVRAARNGGLAHNRIRIWKARRGQLHHAAYGAGARLERALVNFMLDVHTTEHGYTEINPPLLVRNWLFEISSSLRWWVTADFR